MSQPFLVSPKPGEKPTWLDRSIEERYYHSACFMKKEDAEEYHDTNGGLLLPLNESSRVWVVKIEIDKEGKPL